MGNRFEFTAVSNQKNEADDAIDAGIYEVRRIEKLLTTFTDDSETNLVNQFAGVNPVSVSSEMVELVERAQKISVLTDGAFDITYGSIDKSLWNFDQSMTTLPDAKTALDSVALINYRNVMINKTNSTIFLKQKGMRIGFGGIGKGYAADMARRTMIAKGIKNGIVNAAGDLITWGKNADQKDWTVGIANPNVINSAFSSLKISDFAIATSGNYEKYAIIDGKKYSHTIDPKTGLPVSGIKSVSIICPSAELADALTTPVMVMGVKVGLNMINQIDRVACIIVDDDDKLHLSKNINIT